MTDYQHELTELLQSTKKILLQAQAIHTKMEDNDAEQLEALQLLFDKRQEMIQQLDVYVQQKDFQWTEKDTETINILKDYEQKLQPLMNGLHQSFLRQMMRISQTKQVSKKYIGAYQNMTTEGSFIDKRK